MTADRAPRDHDDADPLLDALLDEVLAGKQPPDLTARILERLQAGPPANVDAVVQVEPKSRRGTAPPTRQWGRSWIVAGSLLAAIGGAGLWGILADRPQTAERPAGTETAPAQPGRKPRPPVGLPFPQREFVRPGEEWPDPATDPERGPASEGAPHPQDEPADSRRESTGAPATEPLPTQWAAGSAAEPLPVEQVVAQIDNLLASAWNAAGVTPSPQVPDEVWAERVCRILVGRSPRAAELVTLQAADATTTLARRSRFLDALFAESGGEYARQGATQWSAWLLEHAPSDGAGARALRTGLEKFLSDALEQKRPYDQVVVELLSATGSNDPPQADYNPATNYLLAFQDRDPARRDALIVSEACRTLLGQRMQCAQCHQDERTQRSQESFWQTASIFASLQMEVLRPGRGRLMDAQGGVLPNAYTDLEGTVHTVDPAGLDGAPLTASADSSLRRAWGLQLVQSPAFRDAIVNRYWASALEFGFTLPLDDLGTHNPPSHPELVRLLGEQLAAHRFDLQQLSRWIVLSQAFDRSDVILVSNEADAPDGGGPALFSRAYYRPLLFQETTRGLAWLAQGGAPRATSTENATDREFWIGLRQRDLDRQRKPKSSGAEGATPMGQLLPPNLVRLVRTLADDDKLSSAQQVDHAFWAVLGRGPTAAEAQEAVAVYALPEVDDVKALERIVWSLLNTRLDTAE